MCDVNHSRYISSDLGQLSPAIPPWVSIMSASESWFSCHMDQEGLCFLLHSYTPNTRLRNLYQKLAQVWRIRFQCKFVKLSLRATGCHLPYGMTHHYLPPDTSEHILPYPGEMEGGYMHTEMVYPPITWVSINSYTGPFDRRTDRRHYDANSRSSLRSAKTPVRLLHQVISFTDRQDSSDDASSRGCCRTTD